MKRVLHIVGGMSSGGLENFIMNIYRNLDRGQLQFDMIIHYTKKGDYTKEIKELGGKVYLVPRKSKHPIGNFLAIRRIVKKNGYQTVIRHSANAFSVIDLLAAWMGGAKKRIFQSHNSVDTHAGLHKFFRMFMGWIPTDRYACSEVAGKWMYGKRDFQIVKNAIDVRKFQFSEEIRDRVKKEWKMENCIIYSHVGNYRPEKNHLFLIDVFEEIVKQQPEARLFLIGEGELREKIECRAKEKHIENNVILTGMRSDVPMLLQMTDVFLLPSIHEGFPLSVLEAQAAGLPCLISDRITKEVLITDHIRQMPLERSRKEWADEAVELSKTARDAYAESSQDRIKKAGYDIKELTAWYAGQLV